MRRRSARFGSGDLVPVPIDVHYDHVVNHLMVLANEGVDGARSLAELALNRYFEMIEERLCE